MLIKKFIIYVSFCLILFCITLRITIAQTSQATYTKQELACFYIANAITNDLTGIMDGSLSASSDYPWKSLQWLKEQLGAIAPTPFRESFYRWNNYSLFYADSNIIGMVVSGQVGSYPGMRITATPQKVIAVLGPPLSEVSTELYRYAWTCSPRRSDSVYVIFNKKADKLYSIQSLSQNISEIQKIYQFHTSEPYKLWLQEGEKYDAEIKMGKIPKQTIPNTDQTQYPAYTFLYGIYDYSTKSGIELDQTCFLIITNVDALPRDQIPVKVPPQCPIFTYDFQNKTSKPFDIKAINTLELTVNWERTSPDGYQFNEYCVADPSIPLNQSIPLPGYCIHKNNYQLVLNIPPQGQLVFYGWIKNIHP